MYLKMFRAVWFLSLFTFFAVLLYAYAGLQQEMVTIPYFSGDSSFLITFSREVFFYAFLGFGALINALVFIVRGILKHKKHEPFKAWFHGFVIVLHFFLIIAISFVGLVNSGERYDYPRIGFIIYSSVGLILVWALCWPLYLIFVRIFSKQTV